MSQREDRSRSGLEETVATNNDLRRTLVGSAERGGREVAGAALFADTCNVDVNRCCLCTFGAFLASVLHRATSIPPARGPGDLPTKQSAIDRVESLLSEWLWQQEESQIIYRSTPRGYVPRCIA